MLDVLVDVGIKTEKKKNPTNLRGNLQLLHALHFSVTLLKHRVICWG